MLNIQTENFSYRVIGNYLTYNNDVVKIADIRPFLMEHHYMDKDKVAEDIIEIEKAIEANQHLIGKNEDWDSVFELLKNETDSWNKSFLLCVLIYSDKKIADVIALNDVELSYWVASSAPTKYLPKLVKSYHDDVREAVAKRGAYHEMLYRDISDNVRAAVAANGSFHDVLCSDKSITVRAAVARAGYKPELMSQDKSFTVRKAVLEGGHGAEFLINDKHKFLRLAAQRALDSQTSTQS